MTEHIDWNDRYRDGNLPWDTGQPSSELQRVLARNTVQPCRALELGCGTGTNSVWLAQQGFEVTGVDLAPLAVERAEERAHAAGVNAHFVAADVFHLPNLGAPFAFFLIAVVTMLFVGTHRSSTPQPWRGNWLLARVA